MNEHTIDLRFGVEIIAPKIIANLQLPEWLQTQGPEILAPFSHEALGSTFLHDEPHVTGRMMTCSDLMDDGSGLGEGDIREDLVVTE